MPPLVLVLLAFVVSPSLSHTSNRPSITRTFVRVSGCSGYGLLARGPAPKGIAGSCGV
jgi:hypothetical protein